MADRVSIATSAIVKSPEKTRTVPDSTRDGSRASSPRGRDGARPGSGIRANPGPPAVVRSATGYALIKDYVALGLFPDAETGEKAFATAQPLGLGQPQDIASGVCYLASEASRWMTGNELVLDGGLMAS